MPFWGVLQTCFYSISLLLRAPMWYTRVWYARRRAVRLFNRELTRRGIPERDRAELSKLYPNVLKIARGLREL